MEKITPKIATLGLISLLTLTIIGNGLAVYFSVSYLTKQSNKTNILAKKAKDIKSESDNVDKILSKIKKLDNISETLEKTTSDKNKNIYQEDVIKKVREYGKIANLNVRILNLSLNKKIAKNSKVMSFSIMYHDSLTYDNLFKFFKLIENGSPRMQIQSFDISKQKEGIRIGDLLIDVYVN